MEKEKLLKGCIQQTNFGDDGKVGIWVGISGFDTTAPKICKEDIDGKLHCDVLQHQLKPSVAQIPKNSNRFFNNA